MSDGLQIKFFSGLSPRERGSRVVVFLLLIGQLVLGVVCLIQALDWVDKPFPGFLVNQRMVLAGAGQYHWTGTQAGLRTLDHVVSADGRKFSTFTELLTYVKSLNVGTPVSYSIERGGMIHEFLIATMRFSRGDLIILFGVNFLIGFVYIAMGLVVFAMKPDTAVSWAFFLASFLLSLYHITNFDVVATHFGWIRVFFFASAGFPAAALHLSYLFPEPTRMIQKYPSLHYLPYLVAMLFLLPLEVLYPNPIFMLAYFCIFVYMAMSALALIFSPIATYLRKASILAQQRAKVVLWGALLAFPIPALGQLGTFFGVTVGGQPIHTNLTGIPMLIFPLSIAFAIAKHNLFDVDLYIKRAVGYALMTVIVAFSYFSIQTAVRTFILDPLFGEAAEQVYPIIFAILIVFFFNPAHQAVQGLVDTIFFRKKFDYKDTIASVSNALTSLLDQQAIVRTLIATVRKNMFLDAAGVLLANSQEGNISLFLGGENELDLNGDIRESQLSSDDPLVSLVSREKKIITKYDLAEAPQYSDFRETCGQRFVELGASLAIPLIHQGQVTGVFALGYKKSGHFYSREDVELLETLANQGAVAIENARLAEQMKREEGMRANLSRYLSPQIVERVMKDDVRVNLGGDRKVVTVLFSDIRNFTSISESWPPEQLVQILNEYFTAMAQIIFEYHGSLDKYIGDAIVSVFGSLIPLENPALAAVRASVAMMNRMKELNVQWEAKYGLSMEIGIGVSTGEVFLGNVGSPDRMEFTVIGDAVNVASRFSGLAHAGQVLVTRETFSQLGRAIPYNELPPSPIKGKAEPMEVFEITLSS